MELIKIIMDHSAQNNLFDNNGIDPIYGIIIYKNIQIGIIENKNANLYLTLEDFKNCEYDEKYIKDLLKNKKSIIKELISKNFIVKVNE